MCRSLAARIFLSSEAIGFFKIQKVLLSQRPVPPCLDAGALRPMLRDANGWREVQWEEALLVAADLIRKSDAARKAGQVAMAADTRVTFGDTSLSHRFESNSKIVNAAPAPPDRARSARHR